MKGKHEIGERETRDRGWLGYSIFPSTAHMLEVLSSGRGAAGRELDQELLTSQNDWSIDTFTDEWAARIWGPVEGLMSLGTPLKELSVSGPFLSVSCPPCSTTCSYQHVTLSHPSAQSSRYKRPWTKSSESISQDTSLIKLFLPGVFSKRQKPA